MTSDAPRPAAPRSRDRHGRGLRGPLAPPTSPASVSRGDRFADLVAAAVDRLEPRWGARLDVVDVEVPDVPPDDDPVTGVTGEVPLAAHRARGREATVVVYRKPVELRAPDHRARVDLVRDLVAEQLAEVLGVAPADLDPAYEDPDEG